MSRMLDDQELIVRARRGEHAAYGVLVDRYKDAVLRLTGRILRNTGDAEDAAQDAFVRAYVSLDSYDSRFRFYTWIATIAQNVCFRALRSRDWRVGALDEAFAHAERANTEDGPEVSALMRERDETIRHLVAGLPGKYREVLILRHWHELSYEEIARATEVSLAAVKVRLYRARQMIGVALTERRATLDTA